MARPAMAILGRCSSSCSLFIWQAVAKKRIEENSSSDRYFIGIGFVFGERYVKQHICLAVRAGSHRSMAEK
jgi:hypothetical protein